MLILELIFRATQISQPWLHLARQPVACSGGLPQTLQRLFFRIIDRAEIGACRCPIRSLVLPASINDAATETVAPRGRH